MDIKQYHTSLEETNNVAETIRWKLETTKEAGLDPENMLADYIGLALDNLSNQLSQLKALKAEIREREKAINDKISMIKEEGASFLLENGLERLKGNIVSSVTVSEPKPTTIKRKFVMDCTKQEMEELLYDLGYGHFEEVEVPGKSAALKINKRRVIVPEVEEMV